MIQDAPARRPGAPHPRQREPEGGSRRAGAAAGPRGSRGACGSKAAGAGQPAVIGTGETPRRRPRRRGAPCVQRPPELRLQAGGTPTPPARPSHSGPRPPPAGAPRARGGARGGRDLPVRGAPARLRPGAPAARRGRLRRPRAAPATRQPGTSASRPRPSAEAAELRARGAPRPAPRGRPVPRTDRGTAGPGAASGQTGAPAAHGLRGDARQSRRLADGRGPATWSCDTPSPPLCFGAQAGPGISPARPLRELKSVQTQAINRASDGRARWGDR